MKTITFNTWYQFENEIVDKYNWIEKFNSGPSGPKIDWPLFRGQSKASWELETTLERFCSRRWKMSEYHRCLLGIRPAIQSYTSHRYRLPTSFSYDGVLQGPPPGYDFMTYLRHHGFPSPLLDWSQSPFVAAFFAFSENLDDSEKQVAIFSYIEDMGGGKNISDDQPAICGLGSYVTTHQRHFMQQCEYTICTHCLNDEIYYWSHGDVFKKDDKHQDYLVKYLLPRSEAVKVLRRLDLVNINAYSLFGNEEALMRTLAYKEITRKY